MVAIEDINDRESFETWLRETSQPREACVALAARAALRVLPLVWADAATSGKYSALPFLRANLIASVAGLAPAGVVIERVGTIARRAAASANIARQAAEGDTRLAAAYASRAVTNASRAAAYAAPASQAAHVTYETAYAVSHAARSVRAYGSANAWGDLHSDCGILANSRDLIRLPLFADTRPNWFDSALSQVRAATVPHTPTLRPMVWQDRDGQPITWTDNGRPMSWESETERSPNWPFWLDWYERFVKGDAQNWPLLLEIATQDDAFWQGSDDEVNTRIAEIMERHALKASYAARRVVVDEQTKLLRAEVITEIEPGFFDIALGRLRDAVDEMRAAPGFANQYTALEPELRRIDDYLARHRDKPLRIYEVAVRTCQLIRARVKDGQLPEDDPLLEDFQTEVDNTSLDILHGDSEVDKVVRQRLVGRFDRLDPAQKEHFRGITPQIIPICEESLAQELQEEIATATDPQADSQDQAEAMWRWAGLVLRIFRIMRERVHDYAAYVTVANAEHPAIISMIIAAIPGACCRMRTSLWIPG